VFVSQAAFDRLSRALDDARDALNRQLDYNRTLVQQIVEMRREGFAPPPRPAQPLLSSPVDDAILAKAGSNPRLRTHLMRQRDLLRKKDVPEDEILDRLSTFRDPDPDE